VNGLLENPWWLLAFAAIGMLALLGGIITLFSSLGRRPGRLTVTQAPPVDSQDFLMGISSTVNAPLVKGGKAELLDNGDMIFPALLADIAAARKTVNFSAYIWEPGKLSDQVSAALAGSARNGVQVRLLLDGMGGMRAPKEHVERMKDAGVKVHHFRTARLGKLTRIHKRNHRRSIVIDGRIGYTGGAAVGDKWLGNARNEEEWRDSMVRVTGCIAGNLQSAFTEVWAYVCGEILVGQDFYPDLPDDKDEDEAAVHVNVVSSPSADEHPLRLFYMLTFEVAKKKLYIATPYFVPDQHTRETVMKRARAGVDVRILLPNKLTDAKPIRQASHSYFDELLSAGVRLFEYQPAMMHNKVAVVDSKWCVVGSANMDIRSKELNLENVLGILDEKFALQAEASFLRDLEKAEEIQLDEWRKRGLGARLKERFCVLFAEQY
jgi:cardiolipin synthase